MPTLCSNTQTDRFGGFLYQCLALAEGPNHHPGPSQIQVANAVFGGSNPSPKSGHNAQFEPNRTEQPVLVASTQ